MKKGYLEKINPKTTKQNKYSPNLYAWLKKYSGFAYKMTVHLNRNGVLWIGYKDEDLFIGSNLIHVLCNGRKQEMVSFVVGKQFKEVTNFWEQYIKKGRCAIDTKHEMGFIGEETRWKVNGDIRHCLWCKECDQKKIIREKIVKIEEWSSVKK